MRSDCSQSRKCRGSGGTPRYWQVDGWVCGPGETSLAKRPNQLPEGGCIALYDVWHSLPLTAPPGQDLNVVNAATKVDPRAMAEPGSRYPPAQEHIFHKPTPPVFETTLDPVDEHIRIAAPGHINCGENL